MKALAIAVVTALAVAMAAEATAREWKPSLRTVAEDYLRIVDRRAEDEFVVMMWLAPETVPDGPESAVTRKFLEDYLVIALMHTEVSEFGELRFRGVPTLALAADNGPKAPMPADALPPAFGGTIAMLKGMFAQGMGAMGRGINWFVFDGAGVSSCAEGMLRIPYEGETYEYETPIPGCR